MSTLSDLDIKAITEGKAHDPHSILGIHPTSLGDRRDLAVRVFRPDARSVSVIPLSPGIHEKEAEQIDERGLFEAIFESNDAVFAYKLRITLYNGSVVTVDDPYRFLPTVGDQDLYYFCEGRHKRLYDKLGTHPMVVDGTPGVAFAVWAPAARSVRVIGGFNNWDGRYHPMRVLGGSGVWEIFIPHVEAGQLYKYEILTQDEQLRIKTDPMSFYHEMRPSTASIIYDLDGYEWGDGQYMEERSNRDALHQPMAVYEVHLGSWRRRQTGDRGWLTYREIAPLLAEYVKTMGFTHVELMPVQEHPLDESWGYEVTGYFAPTSRYGTPKDFMHFVDVLHMNGIGVILDWVPAHFPKDDHSLARFDGSCLYEHEDPRKGEHRDWGTLIFNYDRTEVRNFLLANALFWCDKYHLDGLRVDAVASMLYLDYSREEGDWIPNIYGGRENLEAIEFLREVNREIYGTFPGVITSAEESTAWPAVSRPVHLGGLGFGFKWNMGWMHDMLEYFRLDPMFRKHHHQSLTFSLLYAFYENYILPISHDEVVHGKGSLLSKMPGGWDEKAANLRALLSYMYCQPGKKLLFMGSELGDPEEWYSGRSVRWDLLDWEIHRGIQKFVKDLNWIYRNEPCLWEQDHHHEGFRWINFEDWEQSIVSFMRFNAAQSDFLICVFNFTPVLRQGYRVGVPEPGFYQEVLNTDSEFYGGSNWGNSGGKATDPVPFHGSGQSLELTLPPLSGTVMRLARPKG
ncbi:1,4-alpha-glucan branching protein GlgB [Acidobacteriota bacterium]